MPTSDRVSIGLTVGTQPPLSRIVWFTRAARRLGFDVAWTVDHFLGFFPRAVWDKEFSWLAKPGASPHPHFDYQVLLGHLARRAGNLHLGVGVTEPTRRHPVLIAQAFMTLAHLAKRPPILGLGAGEAENIVPYGLDFSDPVTRVAEALEIIRLCFDSDGPFDYEGRHFSLSGAVMDLRPPAGRRPLIWLAAHQRRMLDLAGRFADGWYPTVPYTPATYERALDEVRSSASAAGRDARDIVPGWQAFAVFGRTERAAARLLKTKGVRFTALLAPAYTWSEAGAEHPMGPEFRGLIDFIPQRYSRKEIDAAIDAVPVDLLADQMLWGTPKAVRGRLEDFVEAGLRHIVLQPVSGLVSMGDAVYSLRAALSVQRKLKRRGVPDSAQSSTPGVSEQ